MIKQGHMKTLFTAILILLCAFTGFSQYGVDGAVFGVSHQIKWASTEKPRLKRIIAGQDKLIITNTAIALSQAKLLNNKKIQYQALSKTDDTIKESTAILQVIEVGNTLVQIQIQTFAMLEGYPIIEAMIIPSETDLIIESYVLLQDIYIAITEGESNQINTADRLLLMKDILSRMNALNDLALKIYHQAEKLITLEELALIENDPLQVPLTDIFSEMREEIKTIINE